MAGLKMFLKSRPIVLAIQCLFVFSISLLISAKSYASDPYWLKCEELESVSGIKSWNPEIRVGSLVDFDNKNYIIINGILETPTPGYKYQMSLEDSEGGLQNIKLKLISPGGMGLAVIDKISISERFEVQNSFNRVTIEVDKNFNWGPKVINCGE